MIQSFRRFFRRWQWCLHRVRALAAFANFACALHGLESNTSTVLASGCSAERSFAAWAVETLKQLSMASSLINACFHIFNIEQIMNSAA